ncbi:MAG: sulfotransferase domain-containing protein [Alphaproteobacteria bacterium]|nr:sulfotransferase domain-containing protein [Alphaproteobacteria bacterium]
MSGFHWLASYPKSGNTWLRLALWALRHGRPGGIGDVVGWIPVSGGRTAFDAMLDIESSDLEWAEVELLRPRFYEAMARQATEPMLRKVHEAWLRTPAGEPLFPPAVTLGAIYMVRDPRDVAVALSFHLDLSLDETIAFMADPAAGLFSKTTRLYRQFACPLLTWSLHVESWLDTPDVRVLAVRYEDMVADLPAELGRVARFLGWSAEPEAVAAAIEGSRFDRLRSEEERMGFYEKPPGMERFFRRGEAGGWRDTLTPAQAARIERDHGAVMSRLGYR